MKKALFLLACLWVASSMAQTKGHFEVYDFGEFKLHEYCTNDVMADESFIVEGKDALVTLEPPLFKENEAEFEAYLSKLNKPVVQSVFDYHLGGTKSPQVVMPEGMSQFTKGEVYGGMMQNFSQTFGDAMTHIYEGDIHEVPFGKVQQMAGVSFDFRHGASSDFPAASILIGGKVYYTHWAPAKAHANSLQYSSVAAIEVEMAEAENSLASGAELFIGGHGHAVKRDVVEFKIAYLKKMKEELDACQTVEEFVTAMKTAYPDLSGAEGLEDVGKALYK